MILQRSHSSCVSSISGVCVCVCRRVVVLKHMQENGYDLSDIDNLAGSRSLANESDV